MGALWSEFIQTSTFEINFWIVEQIYRFSKLMMWRKKNKSMKNVNYRMNKLD